MKNKELAKLCSSFTIGAEAQTTLITKNKTKQKTLILYVNRTDLLKIRSQFLKE